MNLLTSECKSSECESGWTLYFESSNLLSQRGAGFVGGNGGFGDEHKEKRGSKEEDEEDLSMISDASSGPPHFIEDEGYCNEDNGCFFPASKAAIFAKNGGKRQKTKEFPHGKEQELLPSFLDDTASSPVINFSKNNYNLSNSQASVESVLDFSQGFSATHFEFLKGRSAFQDHFGFLQSSQSGNQLQNNQWFERKRMGTR